MIKKQSVQQMKIIQNQTYTSSEAGPMNSNIIRYKNGLSKVNNSILLTVIALFLNLQMIKKQSVEWMKRIQNRTCTSGEACPIDSMIIMKVKIVHGQAKKITHVALLLFLSLRPYRKLLSYRTMDKIIHSVHPSKHMPNVCPFIISIRGRNISFAASTNFWHGMESKWFYH